MSELSFVANLGGATETPVGRISDLVVHHSPSGPIVYAVSRDEARITALEADGGPARIVDTQSLPGTTTPLGGLDLEVLDLDGTAYAVALSATA